MQDASHNRKRVQLKVLGISYSQIQSGAYAMILAEVNGPYRIPVVIGAAEAQSIAIKMEGIIPPRPMTHDLFTSLAHAFSLELLDVFIYKFEDGVFSSEMTFADVSGKQVVLDARTSDAIAVAMRTGAPIFTTPAILDETGFIMEIPDTETETSETENADPYAGKSVVELEEMLAELIEQELYEEASRLKALLDSMKGH